MTDNNVWEVEVMALVNTTDVGLPPDSHVASKNKSTYWKRLVWTQGQAACWSVPVAVLLHMSVLHGWTRAFQNVITKHRRLHLGSWTRVIITFRTFSFSNRSMKSASLAHPYFSLFSKSIHIWQLKRGLVNKRVSLPPEWEGANSSTILHSVTLKTCKYSLPKW